MQAISDIHRIFTSADGKIANYDEILTFLLLKENGKREIGIDAAKFIASHPLFKCKEKHNKCIAYSITTFYGLSIPDILGVRNRTDNIIDSLTSKYREPTAEQFDNLEKENVKQYSDKEKRRLEIQNIYDRYMQ